MAFSHPAPDIASGLRCRLPLIIGVTGHRDLRDEDIGELERRVGVVFDRIASDYLTADGATPIVVLSALAEGADQLVARIALDRGALLVAPLPMPIAEYRKDYQPGSMPDAEGEFDRLLARAIAIREMPFVDGNTIETIRMDPGRRALQYRETGIFIVRHCQILLSLWDGDESDVRTGGTAEIVRLQREGAPSGSAESVRDCIDGTKIGALTNSVDSRTSTVGFLAGADLTSRGLLFGNDGLIAGVLAGYASSNLTLNVSSLTNVNINGIPGNGFSRLSANLSGPTAGLYATYFNGGFSTDFTLKVDALTLNETFNELLAFNNGANIPFAGGGSVSLLNATISGNLNYRFDLYPIFWFEPTVGAQYTNSSYGSNAAQLGLEDGTLVMVQGGARFGTTTLINNRILMTTTLTGLAYDDVLVAGGFIPAAAFDGANLLARADQGKVRGRGALALNFDCGQGLTSFVQGEVRGGKGLFGAGGKAGVRVQW